MTVFAELIIGNWNIFKVIIMIFARVNKEDLAVLERKIEQFACQYREMFKSVPLKVHILEDQVIPK